MYWQGCCSSAAQQRTQALTHPRMTASMSVLGSLCNLLIVCHARLCASSREAPCPRYVRKSCCEKWQVHALEKGSKQAVGRHHEPIQVLPRCYLIRALIIACTPLCIPPWACDVRLRTPHGAQHYHSQLSPLPVWECREGQASACPEHPPSPEVRDGECATRAVAPQRANFLHAVGHHAAPPLCPTPRAPLAWASLVRCNHVVDASGPAGSDLHRAALHSLPGPA